MSLDSSILSTGAPADPPELNADSPKEELDHWAKQFGLDPTRFSTRAQLAAAVESRRTEIDSWNRQAMCELLRWGRRPISDDATPQQLARQITTLRSMKFGELSPQALLVLARMRGAAADETDDPAALKRKLKQQEGLIEKIGRKKRAFLGKIVSGLLGDAPPTAARTPPTDAAAPPPPSRRDSIKDEIEESGLWGGISNRIKRTADQYLNQKLDEIEARIDRKLNEIDTRLGEWRDKEIANRLKILKITLWASVIVGVVSLIYAWLKLYFLPA